MEERMLITADGVRISAMHERGAGGPLCFVVVHGFTGGWRQARVRKVIDRLLLRGDVVAIDLRGHGRSEGATTVGHEEILDLASAVSWARELGYAQVVTVGFSLGGAVVLRQAALASGGTAAVDAVVAVSAPAFWYYRGTRIMRVAHWMVETRAGRALMRVRGTRISNRGWPDPLPVPPHVAAGMLGDVPLLIVHGDADHYFPLEHPRAIHASARESGVRSDLWIESGLGHAETAVSDDLVDRIGDWVGECLKPAVGSDPA